MILRDLERGGNLSTAEELRLRLRYFSDGVVLGSQSFVDEIFTALLIESVKNANLMRL